MNRANLAARADPAYREKITKLVSTEIEIIGVRVPVIRTLVRSFRGEHPDLSIEEVMALLDRYGVETSGKRAVVLGRSTLVGLPQVLLLGRKGVDTTPTLAHSRTQDLVDVCSQADIIVAAVGVAHIITADHVKPGAAVIDVGISRTADGIVGDVDFETVQAVAGAITPMPGGTGPMTIASLLQNTFNAANLQGVF